MLESFIESLPVTGNLLEKLDCHKEVDIPAIQPICETISETLIEPACVG